MKKWQANSFLITVLLYSCSPAKDSFLKDVVLNYSEQGFISTDVFQVHCREPESAAVFEETEKKDQVELKSTNSTDTTDSDSSESNNQQNQTASETGKKSLKLTSAERRAAFLKHCRFEMAKQLAEYKIRYDIHRLQTLESVHNNANINRPVTIEWDARLLKQIDKVYDDFLPGYLISEYNTYGLSEGVYRIHSENLIKKVQKRELPFQVNLSFFSKTQ